MTGAVGGLIKDWESSHQDSPCGDHTNRSGWSSQRPIESELFVEDGIENISSLMGLTEEMRTDGVGTVDVNERER